MPKRLFNKAREVRSDRVLHRSHLPHGEVSVSPK
jgi:hypothetical protein